MDDEHGRGDMQHWTFAVNEKNGKIAVSVSYKGETRAFATKDAETIAGLTILRIVNEPTAAAPAYDLDQRGSETKIIDGVFDLATAGDTHLGGDDLDNRVIEHLTTAYEAKTGTDVRCNQRALAKLKKAVESARRTLSAQQSARIEIEAFEGGDELTEILTRAKFEELNMDLFRKNMKPVAQVLKDANVNRLNIDEVRDDIIWDFGGSTGIPRVQKFLSEYFGKEASKGINPDEAVAYRAAVQVGILYGVQGSAPIIVIDVLSGLKPPAASSRLSSTGTPSSQL
ncbi:hypothetical protein C0991_000756 [Blastosporella zonata]|nr:hypothetical protein C0991_000756 [Blastosporella zonata]